MLGLRQLNGIVAKKGLGRRRDTSSLHKVVMAIQLELQGSGRCIGYRAMWQRLVVDHKLRAQGTQALSLHFIFHIYMASNKRGTL